MTIFIRDAKNRKIYLCRMEEKLKAFERLLNIMDDLRMQCPWDKKQTMESLRHLTIEEVYELADAILDKDTQEIKKELVRRILLLPICITIKMTL